MRYFLFPTHTHKNHNKAKSILSPYNPFQQSIRSKPPRHRFLKQSTCLSCIAESRSMLPEQIHANTWPVFTGHDSDYPPATLHTGDIRPFKLNKFQVFPLEKAWDVSNSRTTKPAQNPRTTCKLFSPTKHLLSFQIYLLGVTVKEQNNS